MMCSFEIKSGHDLVWADIPYIGSPIFVVGMVMDFLQMRASAWGRITNIDSFHKEAVPHYSALNNHYVVRNEVDQLFRSGRYYGVSRTQRPTSALYDWRELAGHPEGGEWYAGSVFYTDMSKQLLQRLDAKRRQQANWADEEATIIEELTAAARSVRSRAEKPAQPVDSKKPSNKEIVLAKSNGNAPEQALARDKVARHYLENNGFSDKQISDALGSPDGDRSGGIDLTNPLSIIVFPPPEKMTQHVMPHGFPGNWFDPKGDQTPDSLGINPENRKKTDFIMPQGTGLLSHSKPIIDTWTNPDNPISTNGGGMQVFVNDALKKELISLNNIGG